MKYEGMIYRPPSEANSLILQVTVGCSYNRCTFCHSFQEKEFRIKSYEEIKEDIDEASEIGSIPRVFLADGDALIIPQADLVRILDYLEPKITRNAAKPVILYTDAYAPYQAMISVYDILGRAETERGFKVRNISVPTQSEIQEYIQIFGYNTFESQCER